MTNLIPVEARQIQELYDEIMAEYHDGVALGEIRDAVIQKAMLQVRRDIIILPPASTERQLRALFDKHVTNGLRAERATNLRSELVYILEALEHPERAAFMDPVLDVAHRIGSLQFDKVLRWWVVEDWAASMSSRSNALRDLSVATAEFNESAAEMIAVMSRQHVRYTGDLPFLRSVQDDRATTP